MTFLEMTLSGAAMVLAVSALRALALRRLPKETFVALWWLTAVRLLVPAELPSRFSVYTLLESLRPKAAAPAVPVIPVAPAAPAVTPAPSQVPVLPSGPAMAFQPVPEAAPFPIWTALWITGAVMLALWFLVRYVRWRRRFRESFPADCPGLETCLHSRRKVGLRVTDQIAAPLTYGILHPVILLPRTLDLRDEETVTCVLAHEMTHIRKLDGLFKLVLAATLCLHWFNPAVWLLYVLANRDMELRCDEAAVLAMGEDGRERYALTLIRLAELQSECVPLCGFSQKSGMEERIRAIMSIRKKSIRACAAALALVLGTTTAFATSAKPAEAPKAESRPAVTEPVVKNPSDTNSGAKAPVQTPAENVPAPKEDAAPEAGPEKEAAPEPMVQPEETEPISRVEKGIPIYAAGDGTVKEAGYNDQDGNFVRLTHGMTQETLYTHCQTVEVKTGDTVKMGQPIASIGSAGGRFQYQVLVNGESMDPMWYWCERHMMHIDSIGVTYSMDLETGSVPVCALMDGTILNVGTKEYGDKGARGLFVEIRYGGYSVTFFNCDSVLVKKGDTVQAGTVIAYRSQHDGSSYSCGRVSQEGIGNSEIEQREWEEWSAENLVNGDYPRNSLGETYGVITSFMDGFPDLVGVAVPYTGEEGYVTWEDFRYPGTFDSEEECNAHLNWLKENQVSGIALPMYNSEHDLIGTWISGGDARGKVVTLEEAKAAQAQGWPNAKGSAPVKSLTEGMSIDEIQEAIEKGLLDGIWGN